MNPLYDALIAPCADREGGFLLRPDGSVLLGYSEFVGQVGRYAHALSDLGLEPGDRVAMQLEKSPEMLALIGGCIAAGLVFLPLNTGYPAAELAYFVENSGARLFLCDPGDREALAGLERFARIECLGPGGAGSFAARAAGCDSAFAPVARGPDDLAAFLYTSGTTGRSKGAMISHRNLLSNARVLVESWHFTDEDVLLHALPIFHTHGLFVATNVALLSGARMIWLPKFEVETVLEALPRATTMMGVPTFYTRLLDEPRFDAALAGHMRLFISGSAPMLEETHRQFEARTGQRILERYGMTETNMLTSNPYDGERVAGTVGPPLPGVELKVCDAEGKALPDGEVGMIEVRGENVFCGYWQMPEKTAAELREDGFFITGDLGVIDARGYVSIVGRGKDLIISGGYNIYPKEVEAVIDAVEGVLESAVVGAPHGDFGESPVAVIVEEAGAEVDLGAVQTALDEALARFKHPRHFDVVEGLPRNTMGKVQKAALRERYKRVFG
ncbi:malonate--CoA ligase [Vannielia litorea]|uniref:Malonyl-CoA/methylmalonyl-CoA synthetase n=1 Tax=Vannielia litorea TaxID=1217970 RepID=A0A1N6E8R1_9RHOB|nr:malonyl-CoA synthase [Vannielia litorea]SIN79341.1 malonyl-CoA/methylmalonyl-CoA synthetase [Vannielia litorea]